jgi:serine/threonine protein kinase
MISFDHYCSKCGGVNPSQAKSCFSCGLSLKITAPLSTDITNQHLLQQRYHILAQLGSGGSSAVYQAEDTLLNNRLVAIKAISLSGLKPHEVIEVTDAFNREIQLLSDLNHPNLPHIYSNFADTDNWYLVIDFIEGTTLEKHLENRGDELLSIGEVLEIGLLLCIVLEYLHTRQPPIIYRDLKPANVMLTPDGRVMLVDFGIARYFKPGQARDTIPFGSPGYAAPEQYGRAQTTPRTDIYSLGVMLHQLLTGDDPSLSPFHFAPLQLQNRPSLAGLETLILQMVEVDADKRPANIGVVKQELQRLADEWSGQQMRGLKASGPYSAHPPPPAFWQTLLPPSEVTGVPLAAGGREKMAPLQYSPAIDRGSSPRSASSYWSAPRPQKTHNVMAIAGLVFAILGMLSLCTSYEYVITTRSLLFVPMLLVLPSILAIIFGHIGKHRANTVHGLGESKDLAVVALVLGYLFSAVYLILALIVLFSFM